MSVTKTEFLKAYRATLLRDHHWAQDSAKLDRFMQGVKDTIDGKEQAWNIGDAALVAYRSIGGTGKLTYKALRALPEE